MEGKNISSLIRLGSESLAIMKRRAIRNRSWFKVLTAEDRRFLDAVICTVTRIRSSTLLGLLEPLVRRLLEAIGGVRMLFGEVAYRMRTVGTGESYLNSGCTTSSREASSIIKDGAKYGSTLPPRHDDARTLIMPPVTRVLLG